MTATLAFRTWAGSQGHRRFLSDREWKPYEMVTRIDQELPEVCGVLVLHVSGRSNVDTMVFQLPTKPDLYFMAVLHEGWGDRSRENRAAGVR